VDPVFKIQNFFSLFNATITNVEMQHRITSPYSYHTALQVHDGYTVTMTTVFHSEQGVNLLVKFAEEMEKEELLRKQEARLRAQNPTLQKAYEEYQILLKLIK
jgi:hypothetical protein